MGKKKPIDVLVAEGKKHLTKEEIEQRRAEEEAVRPNDDKVNCPSWVKDKVARKEYNRVAKELQELKLLTNLDVNTLANYCIAFSNYVNATQQMEGQPLVIEQTNKAGFTNIVANPLINIQLKYSDEMKKLASEMGLSISSRLKLVVPKKDEDKPRSKFEEFMDD